MDNYFESKTNIHASAGSCYEGDVADCKGGAKQGHAKAQYNLALKYVEGHGVLQDFVMAHMYWNIAVVAGDKDAIKNRGIVEKDMTSSQLAESQKLTREWMRTHLHQHWELQLQQP